MINHDIWKLSALRALNAAGKLNLHPTYQRKIAASPGLRKSLLTSAKLGGALPSGLVLRCVRGERGGFEYEVIDGRRRCLVLLNDKNPFPANTSVPVAIYSDFTFEQARELYERLNETGLSHTTGEIIKAALAQKSTSAKLKEWVKNQAWKIYNPDRFGGYRYAVFFFAAAHGNECYKKKDLEEFIRTFQESSVNQTALDDQMDTILKIQSVVQQTSTQTEKFKIAPDTYWPLIWVYRVFENYPEISRKPISKLAHGLAKWLDSLVEQNARGINTSRPQERSNLQTAEMLALVRHLQAA